MTAILVIAHAPLATALLDVVAHVHGGLPAGLAAIDVAADADPAQTLAHARQKLGDIAPDGGDVLLLTDVAGATPANLAQQLLAPAPPGLRLRLLAGVSLPLLLRAASYRARGLDALVELAEAGARRGLLELGPQHG